MQNPPGCNGEREECPRRYREGTVQLAAGCTLLCLEGDGSSEKEEMVLSWKN